MGYTYLYTAEATQTIQLYQMFPDFVKILFVDPDESFRCFHDTNNCLISEKNPTGIPSWKIFSFLFWSMPGNPLGDKWTVSPENYEGIGLGHNTYLGYSIEESCQKHPFIPHFERENQAYILAKLMSFFTPERDAAWTRADFDAVTDATGITYILGAYNDTLEGKWPTPQLPSHHVNLGKIDPAEFMYQLSRSQVLVGMGNPAM
jgi:hypothetical protein